MIRFTKVEVSACDEVVLPIRLLRRQELEALLEVGHFEHERVELIDGALVPLPPLGSQHILVGGRMCAMLRRQLGPAWTVLQNCYLALDDHTMPEPDLVVMPIPQPIDPRATLVRIRPPPGTSPAPLVVEISDFTYQNDALLKAMLYAEAGIPTYWLIDLVKRAARLHERPVAGHYAEVQTLGLEAVLTACELPAVAIPVGELLEPP